MSDHAHISLCDESLTFYYEHIEFELSSSVRQFLDLIFEIYQPERISREDVESEMYEILDNKTKNPIYFKSGDTIYLWIVCSGCKFSSLN